MSIETSREEALTALILDLFRLNSRLLISGDRLVEGIGLTSARWQVLGAITQAREPRPVAWLARDMGAARQNVQRIVDDLRKEGIVEFQPNPHHKKAQLVVLTDHGREVYDKAAGLWTPMVAELARNTSLSELQSARALMLKLRQRLEES